MKEKRSFILKINTLEKIEEIKNVFENLTYKEYIIRKKKIYRKPKITKSAIIDYAIDYLYRSLELEFKNEEEKDFLDLLGK